MTKPMTICPSCKAEGAYIQAGICDPVGMEAFYRCTSCGWEVSESEMYEIQATPCFLGDGWAFNDEIFCEGCQERIRDALTEEFDEYYANASAIFIDTRKTCAICEIPVIGEATLCSGCNDWQNELEADYRAEQEQARRPL